MIWLWTTFCATGDLLGQQEGKDALDDRLRLQAHRLVERRAADDAVRGLPVVECDLRALRNGRCALAPLPLKRELSR